MGYLDSLGLKHHTDKASSNHGYLDNYEKYFEPLKDKEITLLEIGVGSGASILMWREYFPNAKIYGIEIDAVASGAGVAIIGDATDKEFMDMVLGEIGEPDIIIDDGSHVGHDMIKTFEMLFPKVKSGGYYVTEDTHVFYHEHYAQGSNVFEYFSGKARDVDVNGRGLTGNTEVAINDHPLPPLPPHSIYLKAMHIHPSLWIFERK